MMHRRGESDSAIVAGKPTNKVERSAAEPVEPRAEAKGNARQQSTDRTQSRGTVSQALERIRQAARQRKKDRGSACERRCRKNASARASVRHLVVWLCVAPRPRQCTLRLASAAA